MRHWIGRVLGGWVVLVLTAAACSSGGAEATSPSPAASPTTRADCAKLAGLSGSVQDHGIAAVSGTSVEIDAGDFFFDPTCLTASSPGTVTITVTNTGNALHNFTVEEQGIDQDVQIGESVTVKVELPAPGSLPFLCKYHSASGMQGAFVVG
jgi:plastocyanin